MATLPSLEHLPNYYPFDQDVLDHVRHAAELQHAIGFHALAARYKVEHGPSRFVNFSGGKGTEYVLLKPADYDRDMPHSVLLAPMNTPVDENLVMRGMRLQAAMQGRPLLVIGSPTNRPNSFHMSWSEAAHAREHPSADVYAKTAAQLVHRLAPNVEAVFGYSLGADTGAEVTAQLAELDVDVSTAVLIESPAVRKRSLLRLLADFKKSEPQLNRYVQQSDSPELIEARALAEMSIAEYVRGLLSLTNIALAGVLADGRFADRASLALQAQHTMHAVVGWGSASELADPMSVRRTTETLKQRFGPRLHAMTLVGMHHAGADDINLHAAIMLQGLQLPMSE